MQVTVEQIFEFNKPFFAQRDINQPSSISHINHIVIYLEI